MKKILLVLIASSLVLTSCRDIFGKRIRGNGQVTTETREASSYSGIDVSGAIDVYISQDSVPSLKVETDENLVEYIETHNDGGMLHIHERDNINLRPSKKIKVYVAGPGLNKFHASGACNIFSQNEISSSKMIDIKLSGASDVKMQVNAPRVSADLSGAGTIQLKGNTRDFKVEGSGSTDIKCFDLMTENTEVRISGAGDAEVFASVKLDVRVSGAGSVRYKGNASVNQSITGAGSVKKAD